jgi:hypothetical protein
MSECFGSRIIRVAVGLLAVLWQFPQFVVPAAAQSTSISVAGTWRVTISTPDGTISGMASFKQSGDVVTGWVGPSENDPIPIDGILKENKFTIKTSTQPGRTVAFSKCDVTVNGDKMVGTIDTTKGTIEFVRTKQ